MKKKYGPIFNSKYKENYFGNNELEEIDKIDRSKLVEIRKSLIPFSEGKLIVTCGYNNQPAQQHSLMIESINKLDDEIKKKIHLVLPLTYPLKGEYVNKIIKQAKQTGVTYTTLVDYLSNQEVAVLRMVTDIAINIQTTDAFAASIQSHLYCQNVVILGEWLNYPLYERNNVYYIKASLKDLPEKIYDAIDNFTTYKLKSLPNKQTIKDLVSWECRIDGWAETYRD